MFTEILSLCLALDLKRLLLLTYLANLIKAFSSVSMIGCGSGCSSGSTLGGSRGELLATARFFGVGD